MLYLFVLKASRMNISTAGYSGAPLAKKLGIKPGFKVRLIGQPEHYFALFNDLPNDLAFIETGKDVAHLIHYFITDIHELSKRIATLRRQIRADGSIWISWPKKASGVVTNVSENLIRDIALKNGLVDIKVCAVDDTWSGLKLVIPVKDR
jgi:coenzyme F420-reducing hydrogenase beta subunit